MAGYVLYFPSLEPSGQWAVKSEEYANIGDLDPITGSTRVVSRNHTKAEAEAAADYHQRQSYGRRRQEQQDAEA